MRGYAKRPSILKSVPDTVLFWLRAEGAAALVAGLIVYAKLGGDWLFFIPLLLVPDLSAIGYLAGNRIGAFTYNAIHNWAVGLGILGIGVWTGSDVALMAGAVLVAHVGMDRMIGYGLKHPSGFKDTHLKSRPDVDAQLARTPAAPVAAQWSRGRP